MERRQEIYRGHQLDVAIDGDESSGYYIAQQTVRFTTVGGPMNVPIQPGKFGTRDEAFDSAFKRLREMVDYREGRSA